MKRHIGMIGEELAANHIKMRATVSWNAIIVQNWVSWTLLQGTKILSYLSKSKPELQMHTGCPQRR